jgi:complex III assembly factor LYRM7
MSTAMAARRSGEALSLFRSLLRTQRKCFKGDTDMLAAVAKQIRSEFDIHKNVEDADELDKLLLKAQEGVEYMQVNIVQAKLNERGNYGEFSVSQSFQPMGMLNVFCTTCMFVSKISQQETLSSIFTDHHLLFAERRQGSEGDKRAMDIECRFIIF